MNNANAECYTCRQNAGEPSALAPRERIHDDGLWRVAHAFDSALAGWLVVVPRRHIASLSELTGTESALLGPLLQRLSAALERTTGAGKCYAMFFAEAPGFQHLHIHLVPRLADLPADRRGPAIFWYLQRPKEEQIPPEEMDRIADELRRALKQV
jgi:diadenosine tetraphosphate (Ap4A) HIT family hydrolase